MSSLQIEIKASLESFRFNEQGIQHLLRTDVYKDLARRAIRVESAAKSSMGRVQPPSPEGHAPATRTGRLIGSITWRIGHDAIGPYADIGSAVLYAPYVELGTSRMKARPYLRPALEAARL